MVWPKSRITIRSCGILLLAAECSGATAARAAVTISTDQTQNMDCSGGVCTPTAQVAVLNVNDLETLLASSSVQVNTGSGMLAQEVEDIMVSSGFSWSSANSLTLDAYRSVAVDQPVAVKGSGGVSLITNDGGNGGTLSFNSGGSLSFSSPANSLSINEKTYALANSILALAAGIANRPSGHYALSASYDASQDGSYKDSPIRTKFKGTFNGLGNTISSMAIHGQNKEIGFFRYVHTKGKIDSVLVTGATITARAGKQRTEALVGVIAALSYGIVFSSIASGKIENMVRGNIDATSLGGLVGANLGTISRAEASVTISASSQHLYPSWLVAWQEQMSA